jgi:hypothetical protein
MIYSINEIKDQESNYYLIYLIYLYIIYLLYLYIVLILILILILILFINYNELSSRIELYI